jgi:nicotinamidase-related amidase
MNEAYRERGGKTALLVIDLQVGVVADGHDRDGVVTRLGKVIDAARTAEVPVVYVQHEEPEYPSMMPGGEDWHIVPEVAPLEGEPIVAKRYPDSFVETTLEETLAKLGVGHLIVTGAQSDGCVRATTYRALAEGYDVTLVSDAHTTSGRECGGVTVSAEQNVAHVNAATPWILYPGTTSRVLPHTDVIGAIASL